MYFCPSFKKPLKSGQNKTNEGTINGRSKVSVQGVVALGGHFATLCQEVDFYEAIFFFIINFQNEKANTLTLLIILIVKSLQIELHSTNLLL